MFLRTGRRLRVKSFLTLTIALTALICSTTAWFADL
jgi:hypothetical protein